MSKKIADIFVDLSELYLEMGNKIELLSKHILELQADKGRLIDENKDLEETIDKLREQLALRYNLEDKVKELEAQIEKMKCCVNCRYCIKEWGEFNPNSPNCKKCHNQSSWKLRRTKND